MIYDILIFFHNLQYYFYWPYSIDEDEAENSLLNNRNIPEMNQINKYLTWRKAGLFLIIPCLIMDLVLNLISCFQIKYNILKYENHTEDMSNYPVNPYNNMTNIEYIINFVSTRKTSDYLLVYFIISSLFILLSVLMICSAINSNNIWVKSKKWVGKNIFISVIWIYLLFINPVSQYLKIYSNTDNSEQLFGYVYSFVIITLLKNILPIGLGLFSGLSWSAINLKTLFPQNIYSGHIFKLGNKIFFLTSGLVFLFVNQLFNNYYISVAMGIFFVTKLLVNKCYGEPLTVYYDKDDDEVELMAFRIRFMKGISMGFSIIFLILYFFYGDGPFDKGMFIIYITDISQFLVKYVYNIIIFKVFCSDYLLGLILYLEKYKDLFRVELINHNKIMVKIEEQLTVDNSWNDNFH